MNQTTTRIYTISGMKSELENIFHNVNNRVMFNQLLDLYTYIFNIMDIQSTNTTKMEITDGLDNLIKTYNISNEIKTQLYDLKNKLLCPNTINQDNNVKIKYDGKELSFVELQQKIKYFNDHLTSDYNDNYLKLCKLCSKLDEGGFILQYGLPYIPNFIGYHINNKYYIYFIESDYKKIFHSILGRKNDTCPISKDQTYGRLEPDCNLKFYYVPLESIKLIDNLHSIVYPYHEYEEYMNTLPPELRKILYHPDKDDKFLLSLITTYLNTNMSLYNVYKIN